jgi:cysteine synthase A
MNAFGGELILMPSDNRQITPELFTRMKAELARQAQAPDAFWADQFHNADAIAGYIPIGEEVLSQLGTGIDVFCAAVGTAGMLVGVSRALKAGHCKAKIIALEPAESPTLSTGQGGPHRVEGIGVGFKPPHLQSEDYDEILTISEADGREMARRPAREEGILAGTSTGLNVSAGSTCYQPQPKFYGCHRCL